MPAGISILKVIYPSKNEQCLINGYNFTERKISQNDPRKLQTKKTKVFKIISRYKDVKEKQLGPFVPINGFTWGTKKDEFFFSWKKEFFVGIGSTHFSKINKSDIFANSIFFKDSSSRFSLEKEILENFPDFKPKNKITGEFNCATKEAKYFDFRDKTKGKVEIYLGKEFGILCFTDYITL